MSVSKSTVDKVLTLLAAVAAPVLTSLVDGHVIGIAMATDIGAIVTAFVAAWHGGSFAQLYLNRPDAGIYPPVSVPTSSVPSAVVAARAGKAVTVSANE